MSDYLRRCSCLGANGVITPGSNQDYRNNRSFVLDSGSKWVRLWADWPSLQPEAGYPPDQGSGAWRLFELDKQIAQANADGVNVMLTSYRFPTWANGTDGLTPAQDANYQLWDRIYKGQDPSKRKDLRFKVPSDLSVTSAWGNWIRFLISRYSLTNPNRPAILNALELCNEPNLQMWPQEGPSRKRKDPYGPGPLIIQNSVAAMFQTAQAIRTVSGPDVMLLGPATADRTGDDRLYTGYDTFTSALLNQLDVIGFKATPTFAWSHHNFTDVEYDEGSGSATGRTTNRAAATRQMLVNRWTGWPAGDAANPGLQITEGGARLTKIASIYGSSDYNFVRSKQADLIQRNWNRMVTNTEGAGIGMVAQYLFYTDVNFDSGLCELDGTQRPAYYTWKGLPGVA